MTSSGPTPVAAPVRTPPAPPRTPLAVQLAPYVLALAVIAGLIVLLALGRISETAGLGLLGVIIGGGTVAHVTGTAGGAGGGT